MKKALIIGLAVILAAVVASGAMAIGPGYGMGMMGHGYAHESNITTEQAQKIAKFEKEILPLREKMLKLRTELMTLRATENPDWNAIADKRKAMVDIRTEIQKKATEAGITGYGAGLCGGPGGMGFGAAGKGRMGFGRMHM